MKIKLDENLPSRLKQRLTELNHDVDTVPEEKLKGKKDPEIWKAAQCAERFLITQDLDFSDKRSFEPGSHYGILLIRLNHPSRNAIYEKVASIFETEPVEQWKRYLVVATDRKIRVRRPKMP